MIRFYSQRLCLNGLEENFVWEHSVSELWTPKNGGGGNFTPAHNSEIECTQTKFVSKKIQTQTLEIKSSHLFEKNHSSWELASS